MRANTLDSSKVGSLFLCIVYLDHGYFPAAFPSILFLCAIPGIPCQATYPYEKASLLTTCFPLLANTHILTYSRAYLA